MTDGELAGEGAIFAEEASAPPNFAAAVPAGIGAALAGAILWAVLVFETQMAIGFFAIAVGALVGLAIRRTGRGADKSFGALGAGCAALGWALGTILCDIAFLAQNVGRPFFDVATALDLNQTASLAIAASDPMDLLFLGIAMYEGYRFSLKRE